MFRSKTKRPSNGLVGRLPLRKLDLNELEDEQGPSSELASNNDDQPRIAISTSKENISCRLADNEPKTVEPYSNPVQSHTPSRQRTFAYTTPSSTFPDNPSLHSKPSYNQHFQMTPSSTFPVSNNSQLQSQTPGVRRDGSVQRRPSVPILHQTNSRPPAVKPPLRSVTQPERHLTCPLEGELGRVVISDRSYIKVALLGAGGSSKVFKVMCEGYQLYALKEVNLANINPVVKESYINELKLLKRFVNHDEIITLHDFDYNKRSGIMYLLLEYGAMDLNAAIKSWNKRNHFVNVLFFWNEMLQAVKVIHDEGVVHNDLKPDNFVLIGARLKLIDFGISRGIDSEKTSFERDYFCGTINYMSPETIETFEDNKYFKVGRPSDIWSLGCILYLMFYGRTPFEHIKQKWKKYQAIVNPDEVITYPHLTNSAAIDIMKKCLQRDKKARPTIDELIAHPYSRNVPV